MAAGKQILTALPSLQIVLQVWGTDLLFSEVDRRLVCQENLFQFLNKMKV